MEAITSSYPTVGTCPVATVPLQRQLKLFSKGPDRRPPLKPAPASHSSTAHESVTETYHRESTRPPVPAWQWIENRLDTVCASRIFLANNSSRHQQTSDPCPAIARYTACKRIVHEKPHRRVQARNLPGFIINIYWCKVRCDTQSCIKNTPRNFSLVWSSAASLLHL